MIQSQGDGIAQGRSCETQSEESWNVWLLEPLGLPMHGTLSIQLPPGRYTLFQRSGTEFELIPWHCPAVLGFHELEHLRASGSLVIRGAWPSGTAGLATS